MSDLSPTARLSLTLEDSEDQHSHHHITTTSRGQERTVIGCCATRTRTSTLQPSTPRIEVHVWMYVQELLTVVLVLNTAQDSHRIHYSFE